MHFNNILSPTTRYLKRFIPFFFSYYNLCLSPDYLYLLCTFKLYMNLNFFEVFVRITSLQLRILFVCITYLLPYSSLRFQIKNVTVIFLYDYVAVTYCGAIWLQRQWTCTLLSSQILQKHLDRRNIAVTLRSFYPPRSEFRCVLKRKFLSSVFYGKMLSVIIDTWCKYLSLGTGLKKQRQNEE